MSNTRNGLLAQIVTASGGTVRNESNRNMLLEDWLMAVGGSTTVSYLVKLSASAGSYYKTNIELKAGYRVEIAYTEPAAANWQTLIGGVDPTDTTLRVGEVRFNPDNTYDLIGGYTVRDFMLDGVSVANFESEVIKNDGKLHKLSYKVADGKSVLYRSIGARDTGGAFSSTHSGIIALFKVWDETGTLIVDLDFMQPPGTRFIPNLAPPLGGELAVERAGYINVDSARIDYDITDPLTGSTEWIDVTQIDTLLVQRSSDSIMQVMQFSNDNIVTGEVSTTFTDGLISIPKEATHVRFYYKHGSTPNATISVKQASGWAEAVNIPTENYLPVTWNASSSAWVGIDDPSLIVEVAQ